MSIASAFNKLTTVTRAKDWHFSFIPHIFGNLYLWLILFKIEFSLSSVTLLALSLLTSFGFAALGYFINEYFDQAYDARAGKINKLSKLNAIEKCALLLGICAITLLPWLKLPYTQISFLLIALQLALFLFYAAPPFRVKRTVYLSVITDALYAYVIPLILSYYTYYLFSRSGTFSVPFLVAYSISLFAAGYRNIIIHYVNDAEEDKKSGLQTLPVKIGEQRTSGLIRSLICCELLAVLVMIFAAIKIDQKLVILFLPVLYLVYTGYRIYRKPEGNAIKKFRHIPDLFYQFYTPALALVALVSENHKWLVIVPFHLVLFIPFFRFHPLISFVQRINFKLYYIWLRQLMSWVVNYTIFFLFLLIGVNLKKRNISAIDYLKGKRSAGE